MSFSRNGNKITFEIRQNKSDGNHVIDGNIYNSKTFASSSIRFEYDPNQKTIQIFDYEYNLKTKEHRSVVQETILCFFEYFHKKNNFGLSEKELNKMKYIFTSNMPDAKYEPFKKKGSQYEASADDFLTLFKDEKISFEKRPKLQYQNLTQTKKPKGNIRDPNL